MGDQIAGLKIVESAPVLLFMLGAAEAVFVLFGPILLDAIKTGVVPTKRGDTRRDENPSMYWFAVSILVLWVVGLPMMLALMAIAHLTDGVV